MQVTLWNTGPEEDTYDAHLYGPTITIHKALNSKGLTTTKVFDHRGKKTNLTKADDVRQLLAKLSVNAANPSIVLTQVWPSSSLPPCDPIYLALQHAHRYVWQPCRTMHVDS